MSVTPQRIAIYRALLEANDHPNPEAIYTRVRTTMPSLSLATIYKTLDALARLGLVSELPAIGNSRRYDANVDLHHHLVCTRCDRVTDYYDLIACVAVGTFDDLQAFLDVDLPRFAGVESVESLVLLEIDKRMPGRIA